MTAVAVNMATVQCGWLACYCAHMYTLFLTHVRIFSVNNCHRYDRPHCCLGLAGGEAHQGGDHQETQSDLHHLLVSENHKVTFNKACLVAA